MTKEKFIPMTSADRRRREKLEALPEAEQKTAINRVHERALLENARSFYDILKMEPEKIPNREQIALALKIAEAVKEQGGWAVVVGGWARDEVFTRLGHKTEPNDVDFEVYGIPFKKLYKLLTPLGELDLEGANFKIIKVGGVDVSIPRRDSKSGKGHKGFTIKGNPLMPFRAAAKRRDFTINAVALDPLTGELIDPYGGFEDAKNKILRAVDKRAFAEDPLRALRAMQLAARLELTVDPQTAALCKMTAVKELDKERVREEWRKMLLKAKRPSIGLEVGWELGIIERLCPEFHILRETPQDKTWHPEGNVWTHTKMVVDVAAEIVRRENLIKNTKINDQENDAAFTLVLASLCHDLGKPATTETNEKGRITSKGHAEAGLTIAERFMKSIDVPERVRRRVLPLIQYHLYLHENQKITKPAVNRLANRLAPATIQELVWVMEADRRGRAVEWHGFPQGDELLKKAEELSVKTEGPQKILMGRHVLELGVKQGKLVGEIMNAIYEKQLDGEITDLESAKELAKKLLEQYEDKNRKN